MSLYLNKSWNIITDFSFYNEIKQRLMREVIQDALNDHPLVPRGAHLRLRVKFFELLIG